MRFMLLVCLLGILGVMSFASLPVPEASYDWTNHTLTLNFTDPTIPLPPVGFERWQINILDRGLWTTYYDAHPDRTIKIKFDTPMVAGTYFVQVQALGDGDVVLDTQGMWEWALDEPSNYENVLPRIVVGYGWKTSVAITNHVTDHPIEVYIDLYHDDGAFYATIFETVPVHGSNAFYFGETTFTGSGVIRSSKPLAYVYLAAGVNEHGQPLAYSFMGELKAK